MTPGNDQPFFKGQKETPETNKSVSIGQVLQGLAPPIAAKRLQLEIRGALCPGHEILGVRRRLGIGQVTHETASLGNAVFEFGGSSSKTESDISGSFPDSQVT